MTSTIRAGSGGPPVGRLDKRGQVAKVLRAENARGTAHFVRLRTLVVDLNELI